MKAKVPDAEWAPVEFPQLCRYLADRSPQPMVAVEGLTQIVRYANPAFRRLLGKDAEHLIGRPFAEAVPEGMANGCAALLDRVFHTGTAETLAEQPHGPGAPDADGDRSPTHWSYLAWPILGPAGGRDAKPVGVMIQVTDTTEIASFRNESVAINQALLESGIRLHQLMEESASLNAELRKSQAQERAALLEAQTANRSKEIFLATLSHELRTPLNAILGWSVLLRMGARDGGVPLSTDVDHGLSVIERNARSQAKLIEDVLDVARVASGKFKLDLRPCDLDAMVFAAADTVRPAASVKGVVLKVTTEPGASAGAFTVMADATRLNQAMLNLLGNAVKFTAEGGVVTVRLQRDTSAGTDKARVVVADTGQGIRPEFLPFVFDRFKQAEEGTARIHGGLGLGLAIVRHIADLHGGTVTAESGGEGRGATFTLELPLVPAKLAATDDPTHDPAATRAVAVAETRPIRLDHLRVLVVDDDEDARTVARLVFESVGAIVTTASSAEEGFQLATGDDPPHDILVSDLAMPNQDGYSLIGRVRDSGAALRGLPAIAVSALASPEDRRRALLAGFQAHLAKPIDPQELILTVGSLAGRTTAT